MKRKHIFKVGETVRVVKENELYEAYSDGAKAYGLTKFDCNHRQCTRDPYEGREGTIVVIANHLGAPKTNELIAPVYCVDLGDAEVMAGRDAIELI